MNNIVCYIYNVYSQLASVSCNSQGRVQLITIKSMGIFPSPKWFNYLIRSTYYIFLVIINRFSYSSDSLKMMLCIHLITNLNNPTIYAMYTFSTCISIDIVTNILNIKYISQSCNQYIKFVNHIINFGQQIFLHFLLLCRHII